MLDVYCGDRNLLLEVHQSTAAARGSIVGMDADTGVLQHLSEILKNRSIKEHIRLFRVNLNDVATDATREGLVLNGVPSTFDVLFARNAIPAGHPNRVPALRSWASLITPETGRMVVTFRNEVGKLGEVAGSVRFGSGDVLSHRVCIMADNDWGRGRTFFD